MSFVATFTGFTGAQFMALVSAQTIEEAREMCESHMCAGDLLTIEVVQS